MSEKDKPGKVVGRASRLKVGSEILDRSPAQGEPGEATKVKAVLFVHEKFNPEEILQDIEVVEVDATTMQNIVERRT